MENRTRDNHLLWIGAGLIVAAIVITILVAAVNGISHATQESRLSGLEQRESTIEAAYPKASSELNTQKSRFASHWSSDLVATQTKIDGYITGGQIKSYLVQARSAQKNNTGDVDQFANQADSMLGEVEAFIRSIDGPPDYFDGLQHKVDSAVTYINNGPAAILDATAYVDKLAADPWNVAYGVKFVRSYRLLKTAQAQLTTAIATQSSGDAVQAWTDVMAALTTLQTAKDNADEDGSLAKNAQASLASAQSAITNADFYIRMSTYNSLAAMNYLDAVRQRYSLALQYFAGDSAKEKDPDYIMAQSTAQQVVTDAAYAGNLAATPTPIPPTPIPYPTSVPQSNHTTIIIVGSGSGSSGGSIFDDTEPNYDSHDWDIQSPDIGSSSSIPSDDSIGGDDGLSGFSGFSDSTGGDDGFSGFSDSTGGDDGFGSFDDSGGGDFSDFDSDSTGGDDGFYIPGVPNVAFIFPTISMR